MSDKRDVQVGFNSGQVIQLKIVEAEFDGLVEAIKSEKTWHTVKDDQREVELRADHVDFYVTDSKRDENKRVGF
jgi:hypothetical protein